MSAKGFASQLLSAVPPDEYRALQLLPPPDYPTYMAPPSVRAVLNAQRAADKANLAAVLSQTAEKAAAKAEKLSYQAMVQDTQAQMAAKAAEHLALVDSFVKSVNRLIALATSPHLDYALPPEVRHSTKLVHDTLKLEAQADADLAHVQKVMEDFEDELDPLTMKDLKQIHRLLEERQAMSGPLRHNALLEKAAFEAERPEEISPPVLASTLERRSSHRESAAAALAEGANEPPPEEPTDADATGDAPDQSHQHAHRYHHHPLAPRKTWVAEPYWPAKLPQEQMPAQEILLERRTKPPIKVRQLPPKPEFAVFL